MTIAKTVSKPIFIAGDGLELCTRYVLKDDPAAAEVVGTSVGLGSYVAIGATVGGPVGAVAGAGMYTLSRAVSWTVGKIWN